MSTRNKIHRPGAPSQLLVRHWTDPSFFSRASITLSFGIVGHDLLDFEFDLNNVLQTFHCSLHKIFLFAALGDVIDHGRQKEFDY